MDGYLTERVRQRQRIWKGKELGHLSNGARRFILGVIDLFTDTMLICIAAPFNPLSQFIFSAVAVGRCAVGNGRMPGRFSALMLNVLSLTVSCHISGGAIPDAKLDDPVSLVCGLILLFAETYARIVLEAGVPSCVVAAKSSTGAVAERDVAAMTVDILYL